MTVICHNHPVGGFVCELEWGPRWAIEIRETVLLVNIHFYFMIFNQTNISKPTTNLILNS